MTDLFLFIILFLVFIASVLYIPAWMTDRAIVEVVRIFRRNNASGMWNAKTPDSLGLGPRTFSDRLADPRRDYKPVALGMLISTDVVRETGQGKLYLSENALSDLCRKTEKRLKVCNMEFE
jgi:hypothetical protein